MIASAERAGFTAPPEREDRRPLRLVIDLTSTDAWVAPKHRLPCVGNIGRA